MKNSIRNMGALLIGMTFFINGVPVAHAAATVPSGFQVTTVASGLILPTSMAFAPDGRIFIGQKSGAVRVVKNGQLLATPVVQLTDLNDYGDRGLEGIALDPNFAQNGYMYIAYTYENTPGQNYSGNKTGRIIRLTVAGDTASLATKVVLLGTVGGDAANPSCRNFATTSDCVPSDSNTHSMGALRFGPDGKLWASLGDGAGYLSVDPLALDAQDIHSLGGKIVRINTDGTAPSDNPFYDGNPNDNQSKVWTFGNRNTYRFSFRPSDSKLFFGDVGWATWEEIDIGAKGANYGWPCREGFVATSYNCTPSTATTDPIYVYDHHTGTASVIGGAFPAAFGSAYAGDYFFGDYSNDNLKRMVLNANDTVNSVTDFVTGAGGPTDIQAGPDGNLWYVALNAGEIRKLSLAGGNQPPQAVVSAAPTQGVAPLTVNFSGTGSTDPNGSPLAYSWNFGDGATGSGTTTSHTYAGNGSYAATLTVTDPGGLSSSASASITVGAAIGDANPHHVSTSIAPTPVVIGHQETITTAVRNDGAPNPFIVDMEIYDSAVHQVAQKVYENQIIPAGQAANFALDWLPPTVGNYVVKIGLFKAGWAGLYEWTDQALAVTVQNRAPATSTPPAFSQATTLATSAPAVGSTEAITAAVTDTGGAGSALVDIETYQSGTKVGQQFYDNQSFAAGELKNFSYAFPVPSAGTYNVSVGIFKPAWVALYSWFSNAASFTAGGGGSSGIPIYQNALAPGWENWSWGSTENFNDTSLVAPGSAAALSVNYTQAWGGLFLHTAGVNTTGKSSLTFSIAGNGAGGQNIQVFMFDAAGTQLTIKNLVPYVTGGISANSFKQVSIPLSDLNASNKTISAVVFQDVSGAGGATINLDAIGIR